MIRETGFLSFNSIRAKFLAFVVPLVLLSTIAVFGLFEFDAQRDANLKLRDKLNKLVIPTIPSELGLAHGSPLGRACFRTILTSGCASVHGTKLSGPRPNVISSSQRVLLRSRRT